MDFWEIVEEMDRQRWVHQFKWSQEQYDMFFKVRDTLEMLAMLDEGENE